MDFLILIKWMNPFSFLGASGVTFQFYSIFDEIHVSKQKKTQMGLFCLHMSHKKEARLIWVIKVVNLNKQY